MSPQRINLYDLLNRNQKVWVQNSTNPIGVISLTLASGVSFPMPKTRDPICLSEHISPDDLAKSQGIRTAIQKGYLRLVPDPHAELYYAKTKKDPNRALNMQDDILNARVREAPEAKEITETFEAVTVSPRVQQMCLEFRHSGITDEEVITKLEDEWSGFTQNDIGYVTSNAGRSAVVRWISKKLLSSEPGDMDLSEPPTVVEDPDLSPEAISAPEPGQVPEPGPKATVKVTKKPSPVPEKPVIKKVSKKSGK